MTRILSDSVAIKVMVALIVMTCLAAIYLIDVRFQARKLQAKLSQIELVKLELREQNRRYLIELTSFSDYPELHIRALEEHAMVFPDAEAGTLIDLSQLPRTVVKMELNK